MLVGAVAAVFAIVVANSCILAWMRGGGVGTEQGATGALENLDDDQVPVSATSHARKKALEAVFETGSPLAVARLLAANEYGVGTIEKLGHSMLGGPNKATNVRNATGDLVAIPVRMTMKLPRGMTDPRMAPKSEAVFLFDHEGNLRHHLGGGMAADGVNGDMGLLLPLGTQGPLCFWVIRFESFRGFEMVSEVHTVQPTVRRVLRVFHFRQDPIYPDPRLHEPTGEPVGFGFRGKQPLAHADGTGADGREHSNWLVWDAEKQAFTGASRLRHGELPAFEVDLPQSDGFVPTDLAK